MGAFGVPGAAQRPSDLHTGTCVQDGSRRRTVSLETAETEAGPRVEAKSGHDVTETEATDMDAADAELSAADDCGTESFSFDGQDGPEIAERLRTAGLRPTRQRLALASLLFADGDRHVSAEMLHAEAQASGVYVSLATVYNTLHQFTRAGLLRELAIEGGKAFFDTNTSNHNHFLFETNGTLMDIPSGAIRVDGLPEPPEGMMVSHIDVVVRLVPKR